MVVKVYLWSRDRIKEPNSFLNYKYVLEKYPNSLIFEQGNQGICMREFVAASSFIISYSYLRIADVLM